MSFNEDNNNDKGFKTVVNRRRRNKNRSSTEDQGDDYDHKFAAARKTALEELHLNLDEIKFEDWEDRKLSVFKKIILKTFTTEMPKNTFWVHDQIDSTTFSRHKFYLNTDFQESIKNHYKSLGVDAKMNLYPDQKWVLMISRPMKD